MAFRNSRKEKLFTLEIFKTSREDKRKNERICIMHRARDIYERKKIVKDKNYRVDNGFWKAKKN